MFNEDGWKFGKCPVCDAITSLDPDNNQLCDRCRYDRVVGDPTKTIVMMTQEDLENKNDPF